MSAQTHMNNPSLLSHDPIVARSFFMELDKFDSFVLQSVSGLEVELDVVETAQNTKGGLQAHVKTLGGALKTPTFNVTRMAPQSAKDDPVWKWFISLRDKGFKGRVDPDNRRGGEIVLYDNTLTAIVRYTLVGVWPSKIVTSDLSASESTPLTETITFQSELITRTL